MTHIIIDRTGGTKNKSSANRTKFIKRASGSIKDAVKDYIANDAGIKSISDNKDKNIKISKKTLKEPKIFHDKDNDSEGVVIGNKNFEKGDTIRKPVGGGGGGATAGGVGEESEDDFYFTLSHEEFINIFFEGLELPDLIKKQLTSENSFTIKQAGFTPDGSPNRLDIRRTMFNSLKRHTSILGSIEFEIEKLEEELATNKELTEMEKLSIFEEIKLLIGQKETIPFLQELDLRYRRIEIVPTPITKAVMFCIMDVSGSMTEHLKEMSKRFFMLLYLFLTKQYNNVEIVFIKHHHEAFEVDEKDFFYSRDTGGTIVSTALKMTKDIIKSRYPANLYNAYICQASDGDNYGNSDEELLMEEYVNSLLDLVQYYAYIEVKSPLAFFFTPGVASTLMNSFANIKLNLEHNVFEKLQLRSVNDISGIYKVFRSLFEKVK